MGVARTCLFFAKRILRTPRANGTNFRVNYQLNLIAEDSNQDQKKVLVLQRMKIMGESGAVNDGKSLRDRKIIPKNAMTKTKEFFNPARLSVTAQSQSSILIFI